MELELTLLLTDDVTEPVALPVVAALAENEADTLGDAVALALLQGLADKEAHADALTDEFPENER